MREGISYPLSCYRTGQLLQVPARIHQVDGRLALGLRSVPVCQGALSALLADYRAEQRQWWMVWRWSARQARLSVLKRLLRSALLLTEELGPDLDGRLIVSWPEGIEEAVRVHRTGGEGTCRR